MLMLIMVARVSGDRSYISKSTALVSPVTLCPVWGEWINRSKMPSINFPKRGPKKRTRSVCHLHHPGFCTAQQRECSQLRRMYTYSAQDGANLVNNLLLLYRTYTTPLRFNQVTCSVCFVCPDKFAAGGKWAAQLTCVLVHSYVYISSCRVIDTLAF